MSNEKKPAAYRLKLNKPNTSGQRLRTMCLFMSVVVVFSIILTASPVQKRKTVENWYPQRNSKSQKIPDDLAKFLSKYNRMENKNWLLFRFPLNAENIDGYFLQSNDPETCSPTGNCSFVVIQKLKGHYKVLLSTIMVQQFRVQTRTHNGYFDIEVRSHGSASISEFVIYKYRQSRYYAAQCGDIEYRAPIDDEDPIKYDPGPPKVTYHICHPR